MSTLINFEIIHQIRSGTFQMLCQACWICIGLSANFGENTESGGILSIIYKNEGSYLENYKGVSKLWFTKQNIWTIPRTLPWICYCNVSVILIYIISVQLSSSDHYTSVSSLKNCSKQHTAMWIILFPSKLIIFNFFSLINNAQKQKEEEWT